MRRRGRGLVRRRTAGGSRGRCRAQADVGGFGGGAGGERVYLGLVLGEDRRGFGREQAGRAQKAHGKDQGKIAGPTTEEEGRMMFTRFTNRTRRSMEAAFEEARMLGHDSLGDEDLLLGILRADNGIAAQALSSLGVTLEDARGASQAIRSGALASIGISFDEVQR